MPHVSKKKLGKKTFAVVQGKFEDTLPKLLASGDKSEVLKEVITKTEKLMLSKRVFIILMLLQGHSYSQIQDTLKVTVQTVARLSRGLKEGKYRKLEKILKGPRWKKVVANPLHALGLIGSGVSISGHAWEKVEE